MKRVLLLIILIFLLFPSCSSLGGDDVYIPIGSSGNETLLLLEKQYEKRPDSIRVGYDYAYALASVKRYAEAVAVLDELEERFPSSLRLLYLEAYIDEKADYDERRTLEEILKIDRGDIQTAQKLAEYHIERGNTEEARSILLDLLRRKPENERTLLLLSKIDSFYERKYVPVNYRSSDAEEEHQGFSL